ncbi:large-conductance mechanosensitive channel protein MscL [Paenibacillus sp. FSL W7-1287]|uniref:large-conductance mechanosensitive channel protein MscL n=1 Tax=Paenibacillus sp. FSL W7-1287 TaxID=2954538 RepID=UPI0030FC4F89
MKILQEFKEFAVKGNVIDLAVGVIIGGAFGKIVTSLVNDIIMPPIGALLGEINFKELKIPLVNTENITDEAKLAEVPYLKYGAFINTVLDFLIVALCIFFMVKGINHLRRITEKEKKKEEVAAAPTEKECPHCLSQVPIKATRCKYCTSELKATSSNA